MESMKILIVDDEAEYLQTLIKRMQKRGIAITGVNSGAEAIAALPQGDFDVVILDVRMPEMSGIEVLKIIKKDFPLVEVIMLTGHANMEVAIEGMELGAFDYLMKPIDIDDLIYKAQDAFQRRTLHNKKIRGISSIQS